MSKRKLYYACIYILYIRVYIYIYIYLVYGYMLKCPDFGHFTSTSYEKEYKTINTLDTI